MSIKHSIQRRPVPAPLPACLSSLHPVLARVYAARDVTSEHQLARSLDRLVSYHTLRGIDAAVEILVQALRERQRILIIGDFDADGATSSALAVRALRAMGAESVDYLVPNRFEYGYGLTPEIVAVACERQPDLIVTVDNGISSVEGVTAAKQAGLRVLITDHHLQGAVLPAADALVNPNQAEDPFPSKALAGVGVIFYVLLALRARLRADGWFDASSGGIPNLARWLDLLALGTVADVVPLDQNNRILVQQGIERIRAGKCCAGISALLQVAGRDPRQLVAADLGFVVGPRLNAAGRLEDMSLGIECLLSDDPREALALAQRLDALNRERRAIEQEMREQAMTSLQKLQLSATADLPSGLCLYDPSWHEGVIGILASRIKDHLHRPVVAFASAGSGMLKGSCRSVPGLHIRDTLDAIATRQPALLSKFGGHAMAAGLSLRSDDLEAFKQAFAEEVGRQLPTAGIQRIMQSDGELAMADLNLELATLLREAGPWGQGFPEPLFEGVFELINRRIVGERHLKMLLRLPEGKPVYDAIAFHCTDTDWPANTSRVQLMYRLDINFYQGRQSLQLLVEHLEPLS